jgi:hypothetical protein
MTAVITLNVSNCGLGPWAMPKLSKLVRDASAAVLTSVNCLKNPLGDEGLATLVAAVEASSVDSICGLTEGQTTVDWSKQDLGPFDCKQDHRRRHQILSIQRRASVIDFGPEWYLR